MCALLNNCLACCAFADVVFVVVIDDVGVVVQNICIFSMSYNLNMLIW